jgi:outer membrane protein OmpA-like peptidoglycan-associated protein
MILTGAADRTGDAQVNLELSQRRAAAVLQGLLARGIPADRFQVLAKGETELPVPTNAGVAELQNRRVEISWK